MWKKFVRWCVKQTGCELVAYEKKTFVSDRKVESEKEPSFCDAVTKPVSQNYDFESDLEKLTWSRQYYGNEYVKAQELLKLLKEKFSHDKVICYDTLSYFEKSFLKTDLKVDEIFQPKPSPFKEVEVEYCTGQKVEKVAERLATENTPKKAGKIKKFVALEDPEKIIQIMSLSAQGYRPAIYGLSNKGNLYVEKVENNRSCWEFIPCPFVSKSVPYIEGKIDGQDIQ